MICMILKSSSINSNVNIIKQHGYIYTEGYTECKKTIASIGVIFLYDLIST